MAAVVGSCGKTKKKEKDIPLFSSALVCPPKGLLARSSMSTSWADDADDDQSPDFAAPPPKKSGWGNVEKVQPAGLVFEDFEVGNQCSVVLCVCPCSERRLSSFDACLERPPLIKSVRCHNTRTRALPAETRALAPEVADVSFVLPRRLCAHTCWMAEPHGIGS